MQAHELTGSIPAIDMADQVWLRLCRERDAAWEEVSECLRATQSGTPKSYKQLKQAREKAKAANHVMLRFLDLLDDAL